MSLPGRKSPGAAELEEGFNRVARASPIPELSNLSRPPAQPEVSQNDER